MAKRFDYGPGDLIRAIGASYRIIKQLGAGGMGACYLVEDTNIGRHFVLKTVNANVADRPEIQRGLEFEARVLGKLHGHDHIVQTYSLNYIEGSRIPFYLMDVLNGDSLRAYLQNAKNHTIDVDRAAGICIQMASALHHAHLAEVIHRDVKPENIILHRTTKGQLVGKLIDFGVFKANAAKAGFAGSAGTPAYMAPEQLRGDDVSPATDIYALGLVFWEMVVGEHPFKGYGLHTQGAVARIGVMPATFREMEFPLGTDAIEVLDQIHAGCLHVDPKKRWNDASTLEVRLAKLKRVLERSGPRRNEHEAVTSPADVPHDVLRQMTGVVDEATLAAPTNPEGVVISPRPAQVGHGFASTLPEAGKSPDAIMTKPQGGPPARTAARAPTVDSRLPTNPPSDPLPEASDALEYGAEDPDSYGKMRAAMVEADKLEKSPAKPRTKPASTTNGVVAPTIVEGPSYPLRIRVSGIWKRIIRSDPAYYGMIGGMILITIGMVGWFLFRNPTRAAAPVPPMPTLQAEAGTPPQPPATVSAAPPIFQATSSSVGPTGSTTAAPPRPSHAPRPTDLGSGL